MPEKHCLISKSRVSCNKVKSPSNPPKQIIPKMIHNCTILCENRPRRSNCTVCKRIVCKGEGAGALGCSESEVGRSRSLTNLKKLSATYNKTEAQTWYACTVLSNSRSQMRSALSIFGFPQPPFSLPTHITFVPPLSVRLIPFRASTFLAHFNWFFKELPQRFRTSIFSDISLRRWSLIFQVQKANQPTLFH